ncbi:2-oxoadipate dioxygenase/decarboxylase [Propioniferax innocua]|uniref:2-oxoadipate dioxygenase/decarboxylase n=1 Tax=Propioniferax innocua TaxID=1753 RepID=A0A542ZQ89_9ACTN|nr:DUF1338 family protein [Propioniferax innocua]TQL62522.1 putative glyoxalase superfamily metalloenzyme YdcJ [Propioniferax innocua]
MLVTVSQYIVVLEAQMSFILPVELRARFAVRLSELYGSEVPAYNALVDVSAEVNQRVMDTQKASAERLGTIDRVTAERHGAIRVGSPEELSQAARIFGACGMYPTGFYDLRDAYPQPVPVVSTAFRPHAPEELARNPFRVFTSMLIPEDRRFFSEDQESRLKEFLAARTLFDDELLELADRAEVDGGLASADADRFLDLAVGAFELSDIPVDRAWYEELGRVSGVAADIGGVESTHINHLTPRVLDIDDLYASMQERGFEMIAEVQGPPGGDFPDLLLRQTSFRALAEKRTFRETDGSLSTGELRVRFGEVEQRGIALTPAGRDLYDEMVAETDRRLVDRRRVDPRVTRVDVAREVWEERCPSEEELCRRELAYFTYTAHPDQKGPLPGTFSALLDSGHITATPIVYEDFLPRSAAGIFDSNLTDRGSKDESQNAIERDEEWLARAMGRAITDPHDLYAAQSRASLEAAMEKLGVSHLAA